MIRQQGTILGIWPYFGSEAQKLSFQGSGSERSAGNDQSYAKTAICLTDAETYRVRSHIDGFSGRRLLLGS